MKKIFAFVATLSLISIFSLHCSSNTPALDLKTKQSQIQMQNYNKEKLELKKVLEQKKDSLARTQDEAQQKASELDKLQLDLKNMIERKNAALELLQTQKRECQRLKLEKKKAEKELEETEKLKQELSEELATLNKKLTDISNFREESAKNERLLFASIGIALTALTSMCIIFHIFSKKMS